MSIKNICLVIKAHRYLNSEKIHDDLVIRNASEVISIFETEQEKE